MTKRMYSKLIIETFKSLVILNEFEILTQIMNEAVNDVFNFSKYSANM